MRNEPRDPSVGSALLSALRLALAGDRNSARRYASTLLRRPPDGLTDASSFREQLGAILLDAPQTHLRRAGAVPLPKDADSQVALVNVDSAFAEPPQLNAPEASVVGRFVDERLAAGRLLEGGLEPPRTLLLTGAPGVGKTMTARFIASQLGMEMYSVDLAALMSSYLGKTGQNLRKTLDYARAHPTVLLLDEFDAVAKRRDDDSDIGELKRIVNVLLLELEHWPAHSVLIAATNHAELLDRAVRRRFDYVLEIELPDADTRGRILASCISAWAAIPPSLTSAAVIATEGWTGSEISQMARSLMRQALLNDSPVSDVIAEELLVRLSERLDAKTAREAYAAIAVRAGMTQREVARTLNVSHPTVGKMAQRWMARGGS